MIGFGRVHKKSHRGLGLAHASTPTYRARGGLSWLGALIMMGEFGEQRSDVAGND
jgi:hypothetical protein